MSKQEGTYVQCTECGNVYWLPNKFDLIENMYIKSKCSKCESMMALNIGNNLDDLYLLYDVNIDGRYTRPNY